MSQVGARIHDQGYRPYEGERNGVDGAIRSVWKESIQRALGMRRKFRFKVVPLLTAVIAYIPALGFMALAIIFPAELASEVAADYADYYGLLSIVLVLFTAFVGPELLTGDRQTGLLGLYLASPFTRGSYLLAKFSALVTVMLVVTMFPLVFLLVGYSLVGLGPDGVGEFVGLVVRIVGCGLLLAVFHALIAMAISSVASRKGFASAGIVVAFLATGIITGVLVEQADAPGWLAVFSVGDVSLDLVNRIYGDPPPVTLPFLDAPAWATVASFTGYAALSAAVIWWSYQRLQVTK